MKCHFFQVETMMSQSHIHCRCEGSNTPDDLHIGACLNNLHIPVINTNRLHQVLKLQLQLGFLSKSYNTTLTELKSLCGAKFMIRVTSHYKK